ncbi:MAG: twin-arginine translocase TatA/TatE family subunit [Candidatus Dormibacteria bacterium]
MDIAGHLPELIILFVLVLIIWGPGKLPDVGAAVGRGIREFRKASAETREAVRRATATPDEPGASAPTSPESSNAPTPAAEMPNSVTPDAEEPRTPDAVPAAEPVSSPGGSPNSQPG